MNANRTYAHLGRAATAWIAVSGLLASEYHGTIKSAGLPIPGATITAIQGDRQLVTTTGDRGEFAFADLADGTWTIEVEMLGFGKLSNQVGVALNAPSPAWEMKMLPGKPAVSQATPVRRPVSFQQLNVSQSADTAAIASEGQRQLSILEIHR